MDATKPYKFIGFGAMDATKPYKFIDVFGVNYWKLNSLTKLCLEGFLLHNLRGRAMGTAPAGSPSCPVATAPVAQLPQLPSKPKQS